MEYLKKEESLNNAVREVINSLYEFAKTRGVNLKINGCDNITLLQDKFWLKEAFNNIIKNCIEHTPKGGSVEVFLESKKFFIEL